MSRLSYSSVMQEILVELRFFDCAVVVAINVLIDRDPNLQGIWMKDVGEMTGFSLRGNT